MKLFYKEKFGNRRIIHIFGIKISYKKQSSWNKIEKYILNNLKGIDRTKDKVLVVIPSDSIEDYENAGYDWLERYYNPKKYFKKVFLLSPIEQGIYEKYGMNIIGVDDEIYKKTLQLIKPDVVRAYGGYWATTFAVNNKVEDIPVVCSVHDKRQELLYKEIIRADCVICMSNAVADLCKKNGVLSDKIRILPNRINENIFQKKFDTEFLREKFPNSFKYILFVGRKSPEKNVDTLLKALTVLPDNYKCIFVGRSHNDDYLKLADELQVQNKCIWIESIKNTDLPYYYSFADCMCTPSRAEGFGIVFIEAAACEAPVITSNIAPMNEYFTHNENAYLIDDYENPQEIAKAIEFVCTNKEYAERIGKNARVMTERFSHDKVDEMEVNIYKSLIKRK